MKRRRMQDASAQLQVDVGSVRTCPRVEGLQICHTCSTSVCLFQLKLHITAMPEAPAAGALMLVTFHLQLGGVAPRPDAATRA
jgi:hypothetical protein